MKVYEGKWRCMKEYEGVRRWMKVNEGEWRCMKVNELVYELKRRLPPLPCSNTPVSTIQRLTHKSVKAYATMPIGIIFRKSLALIDWGSWCLPTRKEPGIDTFNLFVLFPSMSLNHLKPQPPVPITFLETAVHRQYKVCQSFTPANLFLCGNVSFLYCMKASLWRGKRLSAKSLVAYTTVFSSVIWNNSKLSLLSFQLFWTKCVQTC